MGGFEWMFPLDARLGVSSGTRPHERPRCRDLTVCASLPGSGWTGPCSLHRREYQGVATGGRLLDPHTIPGLLTCPARTSSISTRASQVEARPSGTIGGQLGRRWSERRSIRGATNRARWRTIGYPIDGAGTGRAEDEQARSMNLAVGLRVVSSQSRGRGFRRLGLVARGGVSAFQSGGHSGHLGHHLRRCGVHCPGSAVLTVRAPLVS